MADVPSVCCLMRKDKYEQPSCDKPGCPGNRPNFLFHFIRESNCDHDFRGFRPFPDGNGGESVCTKCGMGAMEHTLRTAP